MKTTTLKRRLALFTAIIMALTLWTALPLTASADPDSITINGEAQVIIPGVPHEFELTASGVTTPIDGVKPVFTITGPAGDGSATVTVGDQEGNWNVEVYGSDQWHPISLWQEHGFLMDSTSTTKIKITAPESAALGVYTYSLQLNNGDDLLDQAYTNTLTVLPAVGLDTVTLTAGDNVELAYDAENNEGGDVTFTAATSAEPGIGIVPGVTVALNLMDGADEVDDWTDFFDEAQSAIQYGDFAPRLLTNLLSGPQDLYMGEAAIRLVPKSNAAGHSFTYTVTVSKGDEDVTATGSLKVADAAISSLAAGSNTNLSVGSGGAVTFTATLDPADGIVTGVTVALNLTYNSEAVDWKTYFDADQSTIQYEDFDPINLDILTSYPVDLYPSNASITLVPKSAAAGCTFTYTVTVSKGDVEVTSNAGTLTVAIPYTPPAEPPVDEPPVDEPPVDEPPVDEPPATDDGWVQNDDGTWEYLVDGEAETGWVKDGSTWYYLNTGGVMETGWEKVGASWYYLAGNGAMVANKWFKDTDGTWYYLAGNGAMKTGWVQTDGSWYYLSGNGAMVTGKWFKDTDGSWYYLSGNGKMLTGKQNIGGKAYTFKTNGVWIG
jgi:hypothetical protein